MSATRPQGTHDLGELLGTIAKDIVELFRGEVRLARSELDQKLDRVMLAAIWLVGGALLAFVGLVVILQGVAAALALVLPTWAGWLIVGVLIVVVGGLFARSGLAMLSLKTLTPTRMIASLQKALKYHHEVSALGVLQLMSKAVAVSENIPEGMSAGEAASKFATI